MRLFYLIARAFLHMRPRAVVYSYVDSKARIGAASQVVHSKINQYSYCGTSCVIVNVSIGSFCSIADNVMIGGATHTIDHVSTSPIFHQGRNPFNKRFCNTPSPEIQRTHIGHDVWVGHGAKIASGVKIGHGAIIAMGAVVTRDVEPYTIVGGVPAKLIRYRFDSHVIAKLLEIQWWSWSDKKIAESAELFKDPVSFVSTLL